MSEAITTPAAPGTPAAAAPAVPEAKPGVAADIAIGDGEGGAPGTPFVDPEPKGPVTIEFNPTGSAALDLGLSFVGKLGIGPGDAAFDAAANGDFGMLKAKLGQLGDKAKGHEGMIALLEQEYAKGAEANKEKVSKNVAAIHTAVGGEENWKAIQKWASEKADPEEKRDVNAALKAGGTQAKAMALWLADKYAKATGTTVEPASVARPDAAGEKPGAGANGALTAKAYAMEVQATRAKLGFKFEGSKEYQSLMARREAGRRAGI